MFYVLKTSKNCHFLTLSPPQTSAYVIYEWSPEAISAEGLRGKWTEYMKCQGKTDFITGVRLKSEPWKGWGKPSSQSTNKEVKEFLKEHTTYFFYVYVSAKKSKYSEFLFHKEAICTLGYPKALKLEDKLGLGHLAVTNRQTPAFIIL